MKYGAAFFLILILGACVKVEPSETMYFDFKSYFQGEIDKLGADPPPMVKVVTLDGKRETLKYEATDSAFWLKQLQPFLNLDINVPVYKGSYIATESTIDSTLDRTAYFAQDKKFPIREIAYYTQGDSIVRITAREMNDNRVFELSKYYTYIPGHSYLIVTKQKTAIGQERINSVEGRFLNKD